MSEERKGLEKTTVSGIFVCTSSWFKGK